MFFCICKLLTRVFFQSLEHLDLDDNALENFPEMLTTCTVICPHIIFFLNSRQLRIICRLALETWTMTFSKTFLQQELRILRMAENNIRVVNAGLTALSSLREFHAGNNQIFTVLGDLSSLTNLEVSFSTSFSRFTASHAETFTEMDIHLSSRCSTLATTSLTSFLRKLVVSIYASWTLKIINTSVSPSW